MALILQINRCFHIALPKDRASVCQCYNKNTFLWMIRGHASMSVKARRMAKLEGFSSYAFMRSCAAVVVGSSFPMGWVRNGCNRAAHSKRLWKHIIVEESCCVLGMQEMLRRLAMPWQSRYSKLQS